MAGKKTNLRVAEQAGEGRPDPEVVAKPRRRTFTARYKLKILEEADECREEKAIGELLRREGLYWSHLSKWRRQRETGALKALGQKRGRKAQPRDEEKEKLRKENERLRRRLQQAEQIIEIQKKVASLMGHPLNNDENDGDR